MSLREMLQSEVDRLAALHQANADAYHEVRDRAQLALAEAAALKDVAHASANELGAAKAALAEFDKKQGRTVQGAGSVKAGEG